MRHHTVPFSCITRLLHLGQRERAGLFGSANGGGPLFHTLNEPCCAADAEIVNDAPSP